MELRYILLGVGAIFVLLMLWDGIRRNRKLMQKQSILEKPISDIPEEDTFDEVLLPDEEISEELFSENTEVLMQDEPQDDVIEKKPQPQKIQNQGPTNKNYLVFYVMAPVGKEFKGKDIFNAMMKNGCRYGDMRIFHRHLRIDGKGGTYFSVASAVSPGTFNLKNMPSYSTPGLSFFMNIKQQVSPRHSLQLMLNAARQVAEQLKGIVCDDEHRPFTGRKLDEYEERIAEVFLEHE